MSNLVRVGTRGSLLARTQTDWVIERLRQAHPTVRFDVVVIRTAGDVHTQQMPARLLGKGFFTKEIEEALLARTVDLAVHSLKDLPTDWAAGLGLGAIPVRADSRDALVGVSPAELRQRAGELRIGTSSLRRTAQLKCLFPGCNVVSLRGNIDTRLRKVKEGAVDCAVLAAAGLLRVDRGADISGCFDPDEMLPAPGQGALAVEIRDSDQALRALLQPLHCAATQACVTAERTFMRHLGGGCQLPVAALAVLDKDTLRLRGRVLSLDGTQVLNGAHEGPADRAAEIGQRLADTLLTQGAAEVIRDVERSLQQEIVKA
ncbi:MAG: hydroxymethylbilane synthase [Lentisphaerae bacterium RIFOXYB12_FULL_65_16]|nr:MAG: hydroxymethylbilane synthase [Lentisphaerae bacterium RIFOXYA12_64_32]OGV88834.1 MAG: hydroxymethylbilane synthase [Lentisphaerae bacterium RIFOXYB12_FULL_65_16]